MALLWKLAIYYKKKNSAVFGFQNNKEKVPQNLTHYNIQAKTIALL